MEAITIISMEGCSISLSAGLSGRLKRGGAYSVLVSVTGENVSFSFYISLNLKHALNVIAVKR